MWAGDLTPREIDIVLPLLTDSSKVAQCVIVNILWSHKYINFFLCRESGNSNVVERLSANQILLGVNHIPPGTRDGKEVTGKVDWFIFLVLSSCQRYGVLLSEEAFCISLWHAGGFLLFCLMGHFGDLGCKCDTEGKVSPDARGWFKHVSYTDLISRTGYLS